MRHTGLRGAEEPGTARVKRHVWRQAYLPLVLPQEEMLPENFVCFGPKFDVDRDEIVSSVSTFLQDTYRGW
jgi:hypothetical protein